LDVKVFVLQIEDTTSGEYMGHPNMAMPWKLGPIFVHKGSGWKNLPLSLET
jgi:hypothetical protein